MRLYMGAVLPAGKTYSFWGTGVSQGHSDAIRRISGVAHAVQYTIPVVSALEKVRGGETPTFTTREKHTRECFVVAEENADKAQIETEIKNMPHYFDEYDTTVKFISAEELQKNHSAMPHGGNVLHTGQTSAENTQVLEFSLKLDSNPEFTSSVLLAYARAAVRLNERGESGARTVFDIPPILLAEKSAADIVKNLL
jgi:diaminopimelate dehydrogenase